MATEKFTNPKGQEITFLTGQDADNLVAANLEKTREQAKERAKDKAMSEAADQAIDWEYEDLHWLYLRTTS